MPLSVRKCDKRKKARAHSVSVETEWALSVVIRNAALNDSQIRDALRGRVTERQHGSCQILIFKNIAEPCDRGLGRAHVFAGLGAIGKHGLCRRDRHDDTIDGFGHARFLSARGRSAKSLPRT
jgi:hypothetical protein